MVLDINREPTTSEGLLILPSTYDLIDAVGRAKSRVKANKKILRIGMMISEKLIEATKPRLMNARTLTNGINNHPLILNATKSIVGVPIFSESERTSRCR